MKGFINTENFGFITLVVVTFIEDVMEQITIEFDFIINLITIKRFELKQGIIIIIPILISQIIIGLS